MQCLSNLFMVHTETLQISILFEHTFLNSNITDQPHDDYIKLDFCAADGAHFRLCQVRIHTVHMAAMFAW